jgi:hypothetical protein
MKVILIVLLIAVIGLIVWLAARSRAGSRDTLPAEDRREALTPDTADDTVIAPPLEDIATTAMGGGSPLPVDPEPEEHREPIPEPEVMAETAPPVEPGPAVVEPIPEPDPIAPELPIEPEPIIEPDPQPAEPEPVIEPDTAGMGSPQGDGMATDPDDPTDPPQAVIDAGEMPAQELDPHAGWEADEDRTIHADPESGLYHTPDSPGYKIGPDGQVFESEEEAQSAGFTRWDQPDQPAEEGP